MKKLAMSRSNVVAKLSVTAALLLISNLAVAGDPISVPEPGPFGLLILAGVALAIARRFRRNK